MKRLVGYVGYVAINSDSEMLINRPPPFIFFLAGQ